MSQANGSLHSDVGTVSDSMETPFRPHSQRDCPSDVGSQTTLIVAVLLRRFRYAWLINPAITILTHRDVILANGTAAMFAEDADDGPALAIMGRAHLRGYARELVAHHGFEMLDLD